MSEPNPLHGLVLLGDQPHALVHLDPLGFTVAAQSVPSDLDRATLQFRDEAGVVSLFDVAVHLCECKNGEATFIFEVLKPDEERAVKRFAPERRAVSLPPRKAKVRKKTPAFKSVSKLGPKPAYRTVDSLAYVGGSPVKEGPAPSVPDDLFPRWAPLEKTPRRALILAPTSVSDLTATPTPVHPKPVEALALPAEEPAEDDTAWDELDRLIDAEEDGDDNPTMRLMMTLGLCLVVALLLAGLGLYLTHIA